MLDIEVVPELAVRHKTWEFILGMPIQQVIGILRAHDNIIRAVDLWYDDKSPFSSNIVVVLPGDGLRFHFDPFLQRLRLIEVFDLSKIILRYWSQYFNSSSVIPSVQEILRIFGSTKPLLDTGEEFRLCYRGITFFFKPVDSSFGDYHSSARNSSEYVSSSSSTKNTQSALIVSRLFIYAGTDLCEAKVPLELPSACYLHNVFLDRVEVIRSTWSTKFLRFHLVTQDLQSSLTREPQIRRFVRTLTFGDSVQDVLSALGSPSRIFYKTEDKMKIHLPQSFRLKQPRRSDYFFNYFTLGMDILFDARYHKVIKFVLHTNQPDEYSFNTYYRCLFELPISTAFSVEEMSPTEQTGAIQSESNPDDRFIVTPFVKWSSIRAKIDKLVDVDPVVIHRDVKPLKNPFGPTHAYGYQDIIFEVIPAHGYLASITLYAPANDVPEE